MKKILCSILFVLLISFSFAGESYATVNIHNIGFSGLEDVKNNYGVKWSVELDQKLLVLGNEESLAKIAEKYSLEKLDIPVRESDLRFVRGGHKNSLAELPIDILVTSGRFAVIQARGEVPPSIPLTHNEEACLDPVHSALVHATLMDFAPNVVLSRDITNQESRTRFNFAPHVANAVSEVDGQRWFKAVEKLTTYNRYTYGEEIHDARDWLVSEYQKLPGMEVETQEFQMFGTKAYNVVATLKGTTRPDEWYIVGGHYDSTSEDPRNQAPGAEDNGSGAAGVLEMARVFAKYRPEATIIFMSFSGEEQGLYGSKHHVKTIENAGNKSKVKAVLNMDMIGFSADQDLDCLLETGTAGKFLAEIFTAAGQNFTSLRLSTSFNPFGSDHVPYIRAGILALLTIENDWDVYPAYHKKKDLPNYINVDLGQQILQMNVAVMSQLAGHASPVTEASLEK